MIQDQLSKEERVRLEALAQAIASRGLSNQSPSAVILARAKEFELWILGGKP